MALETLLHFENCSSSYLLIVNYLRSVGYMSSKSSCPSFVSSYCLLRGTAGLSSCRQSLSTVVTSLRRFHVFVSSVFPIVDLATYLV